MSNDQTTTADRGPECSDLLGLEPEWLAGREMDAPSQNVH